MLMDLKFAFKSACGRASEHWNMCEHIWHYNVIWRYTKKIALKYVKLIFLTDYFVIDTIHLPKKRCMAQCSVKYEMHLCEKKILQNYRRPFFVIFLNPSAGQNTKELGLSDFNSSSGYKGKSLSLGECFKRIICYRMFLSEVTKYRSLQFRIRDALTPEEGRHAIIWQIFCQ